MSKHKKFLLGFANKSLVANKWITRIVLLVFSGIVLFDSFVHQTPLYYILFIFLGMFIGLVYSKLYQVKTHNNTQFTLEKSPLSFLFALILLFFRFWIGKKILEDFNVVWTADAIYLIFIGLYHSKWQSIYAQMDQIILKNIHKLR